jgi:hypothetical protein
MSDIAQIAYELAGQAHAKATEAASDIRAHITSCEEGNKRVEDKLDYHSRSMKRQDKILYAILGFMVLDLAVGPARALAIVAKFFGG